MILIGVIMTYTNIHTHICVSEFYLSYFLRILVISLPFLPPKLDYYV